MRSPLVTQGYFNNPQATKETFHDGWFCTGDIGVMRDGKFYVVDRKKVGFLNAIEILIAADMGSFFGIRNFSNTKVGNGPPPHSSLSRSSLLTMIY